MPLQKAKFVRILFPLLFYAAFHKYELHQDCIYRSELATKLANKRCIKHHIQWTTVNICEVVFVPLLWR